VAKTKAVAAVAAGALATAGARAIVTAAAMPVIAPVIIPFATVPSAMGLALLAQLSATEGLCEELRQGVSRWFARCETVGFP
jgi:hypothetical protein